MDEVLGFEYQEPGTNPVTPAAAEDAGGGATLELNNISKRFGEHAAVTDVSLSVGPGQLLALIGASGSGKTTTLRMVAGYEVPDSGSITLGGEDITALAPQRRGFGMVFQHYALFPHMPVEQNVAFGLEARGVSKADRLEQAAAALKRVGLGDAGRRPVQSLSGGEQQRVALARALVVKPRALLLDEPLSNLDPALRQAMREDLRALLHAAGVPALFVTHDQEDAFAIADTVALLRNGRILQMGTPEELYHTPASRDVAGFIGRSVTLAAVIAGDAAEVTVGGVTQRFPIRRAESATRLSGSVYAIIRAASLELCASDEKGSWTATITDKRFAGSATVYRARLASGLVVEVETGGTAAREGETVGVLASGVPVAVVSE